MSIISALSYSKQVRVKVSCTEFLSQVRDGLREYKSIMRKMSVICNKQFAPLKSSSLLTVHIVRGPGTYRWFGSPMANRNDSNGKSAMCVSPLIPQTLLSQRINRSSQQAHQSKENAFIHRWGIASIRCGNGLEKTPSVPFRLVSLSLYWRFIFATNFQRQKEVAIWKWKTYNKKKINVAIKHIAHQSSL